MKHFDVEQQANFLSRCRTLASKHFSIKPEVLMILQGMCESGDALNREYSKIRQVFQDSKLSWVEIDKLNNL